MRTLRSIIIPYQCKVSIFNIYIICCATVFFHQIHASTSHWLYHVLTVYLSFKTEQTKNESFSVKWTNFGEYSHLIPQTLFIFKLYYLHRLQRKVCKIIPKSFKYLCEMYAFDCKKRPFQKSPCEHFCQLQTLYLAIVYQYVNSVELLKLYSLLGP